MPMCTPPAGPFATLGATRTIPSSAFSSPGAPKGSHTWSPRLTMSERLAACSRPAPARRSPASSPGPPPKRLSRNRRTRSGPPRMAARRPALALDSHSADPRGRRLRQRRPFRLDARDPPPRSRPEHFPASDRPCFTSAPRGRVTSTAPTAPASQACARPRRAPRARDDLLRSTPLGWACRWGTPGTRRTPHRPRRPVDEPDAEPWATPRAGQLRRKTTLFLPSWENPGNSDPVPCGNAALA